MKNPTDGFAATDHIRAAIRALLRGAPIRRSGMQKVVDNFVKGLERLSRLDIW